MTTDRYTRSFDAGRQVGELSPICHERWQLAMQQGAVSVKRVALVAIIIEAMALNAHTPD